MKKKSWCILIIIIIFLLIQKTNSDIIVQNNNSVSEFIALITHLCLEDSKCRTKYSIDENIKTPRGSLATVINNKEHIDLQSELNAVFSSHGFTQETNDVLVRSCNHEGLSAIVRDIHSICIPASVVVETRASMYHIGTAAISLFVVLGTYIALFMMWGLKKNSNNITG